MLLHDSGEWLRRGRECLCYFFFVIMPTYSLNGQCRFRCQCLLLPSSHVESKFSATRSYFPFNTVYFAIIFPQDPHLRRKALQMLTRRLDPAGRAAPRLSPAEETLFVEMVPSLRSVVTGVKSSPLSWSSTGDSSVGDDDSAEGLEEVMGQQPMDEEMSSGERDATETSVNRQTALLTLDVLARVLGTRYQTEFVDVLADVTSIVAGDGPGALAGIVPSLRV